MMVSTVEKGGLANVVMLGNLPQASKEVSVMDDGSVFNLVWMHI
jgi:hypothetical protein